MLVFRVNFKINFISIGMYEPHGKIISFIIGYPKKAIIL